MSVSPGYAHHCFAPKDMTVSPAMLLPRPFARIDRFPFNDPSIRYHYLGRGATVALVEALGLAGQEMLFPAYFEPPILDAPLAAGATARFYPVRPGMRTEVDDILAALTPATKAIYLIHYVGFPAPVREVMAIARERNLLVIEDAAHALLSHLDGQPLGSFGNGAIYSFYKWAPVPNGGALTCRGPVVHPPRAGRNRTRASGFALPAISLLDHAALKGGKPGRTLRVQARSVGHHINQLTRLHYVSTGCVQFEAEEADLAMSPIGHHILRAQDFDAIAAVRRRNYQILAGHLADIAPPEQGDLLAGVTPLFYATQVNDKRRVLAELAARGIEGRNFWEPTHPLLPSDCFPEAARLRQRIIELPIHQDLSPETMTAIALELRSVLTGRPIHHTRRPAA